MPLTLPEDLPLIAAEGRRRAQRAVHAALDDQPGTRLRTREFVRPVTAAVTIDGIPRLRHAARPAQWIDRLIRGDNLRAMAALLAGDEDTPSLLGRLDLIYADPPLAWQTEYRSQVALPRARRSKRPAIVRPFAYSDRWQNGTVAYLEAMAPRLVLMRELLSETGSLMIHLAGPASQLLRALLDEIFGSENFVRDVIWTHGGKAGEPLSCIAHYAKDRVSQCIAQNTAPPPLARGGVHARGTNDAADATSDTQTGSDSPLEHAWAREKPRTDPGHSNETGWIAWSDIAPLHTGATSKPHPSHSAEFTGYCNQKPERLLERIIEYACPKDGLIGDVYGGSGTAAVAAARLGRHWISVDASAVACAVVRRRLVAQRVRPYVYQCVESRTQPPSGHEYFMGNLVAQVLKSYGASPLPADEDPAGNLGAHISEGKKTLVRVDPPDRPTGELSLQRAIAQFRAGWDQVVLLGWNFESSLCERLRALQQPGLDVLAIQPAALGEGQREDGTSVRRPVGWFRSLRELRVQPVGRERTSYRDTIGDGTDVEIIEVTLDSFALLSPDAVDLAAGDCSKLVEAMAADPLALIDYWAVDPDYDGNVFRSVWQTYRGDPARGRGHSSCVVSSARFEVPYRNSERRVCVRAVDLFGAEVEVELSAPVPDVALEPCTPLRVGNEAAPPAETARA